MKSNTMCFIFMFQLRMEFHLLPILSMLPILIFPLPMELAQQSHVKQTTSPQALLGVFHLHIVGTHQKHHLHDRSITSAYRPHPLPASSESSQPTASSPSESTQGGMCLLSVIMSSQFLVPTQHQPTAIRESSTELCGTVYSRKCRQVMPGSHLRNVINYGVWPCARALSRISNIKSKNLKN